MDKLHETVVDLELTAACCSCCTFCPRERISRLSYTVSDETVALLAERLSPRNVVWFSGMGEPLLHKQFVPIVKALRETGCLVYTNTNGMAPQTEVKLALAKPDFINLSLYGMDEESFRKTTGKDMFKVVVERMKWLQSSGLSWRASYVTEEQDEGRLADLHVILDRIAGCHVRVLRKHARAFSEEGQEILPVCGLCEHYLFLACDGRVLSCAHDVAAENAFEGDLAMASEAKRAAYPFATCSRCESQGLKRKALEPGYFDKVRSLGKRLDT
jgi:pyruvate-formate lyase-activating enzyme